MNFNTLPGTRFVLNDSTLSVGPPPPSGDAILIVGTALDGPVNTPVALQNLQNVESLFGPGLYDSSYVSPDSDPAKKGTYSYNSLLKACSEVVAGGGANIILVRVGGLTAVSPNSPTLLGGITAQALFPGNVYNGSQLSAVSDSVNGTVLTIVTQPSSKGGQGVAFHYPPTANYGQICQLFNQNPVNKTFQLRCPVAVASGTAVSAPATLTSVTLAGGTNGTMAVGDDFYANKQAYYTAITQTNGTFDQISGVNADILLVPDIYADDDVANSASASFITSLGAFCFQQSRDNYPTLAMIGVRPTTDTSRVGIQNRVNQLTTVSAGTYDVTATKQVNIAQFIQNGIPYTDPNDSTGQTVDIGRYLSIIAGPDLVYSSPVIGSYVDSGATFYAGMVSQNAPQQATTNQAIGRAVSLAYQYTKNQRILLNSGINFTGQNDGLGGGAYVTFTLRQPGQGAVVVTEDVTAVNRTSSFTNLQIMRIMQAAERVVESITQNFIGQANEPGTVATLQSQLQTGLDVLSAQGALFGGKGSGYDFTIGSNTADGTLGIIRIAMWLRPAREIRRIETVVTVRNS